MVKCGIYKITSPSGKVYIGQAIDINKRWSEYKLSNSNLKRQPRIYRSFIKYGVDGHIFEIIEECNESILNEREIYWGNYYGVLGINGLNCRLGNSGGKISEEVKKQISKSSKGLKKPIFKRGKDHAMYGVNKTQQHKDNISKSKQNIPQSTLDKMSLANKGKKLGKKSIGSGRRPGFKHSVEGKIKMSLAKLNKPSNHKGYKDSIETLMKKSLSKKGKPSPKKGKTYKYA